jgi:hypothetical protein
MAQSFTIGAVIQGTPVWTDAAGNVTIVDSIIGWETSDATLATIDANGIATLLAVGTVQLRVRADADLDEGEVRELVLLGDIEILAAEAVAGTLTFAVVP